jgi:hypothetical protein
VNYIFISSYPGLKLAFYFARNKTEFTIVTPTEDVIKLCNLLNYNCISYKLDALMPVKFFWLLSRYKKKLNIEAGKIIKKLDSGRVFYTIPGVDLTGMELISVIARQRKDIDITYWQDGEFNKKKIDFSLKKHIVGLLVNTVYSTGFEWVKVGEGEFLFNKDNFISKNKISIWEGEDVHALDNFKGIDVSFDKIPILIIGGYSLEQDSQMFSKKDMVNVFSHILKSTKDVYYKPHPGNSIIDPIFKSCKLVPAYIPLELLTEHIDVAIGVMSVSMEYLAKNGVNCISIMDMVEVYEDVVDEVYWKKRMNRNSEFKIKFPQNRLELDKYFLV